MKRISYVNKNYLKKRDREREERKVGRKKVKQKCDHYLRRDHDQLIWQQYETYTFIYVSIPIE